MKRREFIKDTGLGLAICVASASDILYAQNEHKVLNFDQEKLGKEDNDGNRFTYAKYWVAHPPVEIDTGFDIVSLHNDIMTEFVDSPIYVDRSGIVSNHPDYWAHLSRGLVAWSDPHLDLRDYTSFPELFVWYQKNQRIELKYLEGEKYAKYWRDPV